MVKNRNQTEQSGAAPSIEKALPQLPHERDESDQSQSSPPRKVMQQAAKDIASGQVDTDLRNGGGVENVVQPRPLPDPHKK